MRRYTERGRTDVVTQETASLPFDERQKVRNRVTTASGLDCGIFIERGSSLKDGDVLLSADGSALRIRAAEEPLSEVRSADLLALVRLAYHLGNRHVSLQIEAGAVRYQQDHVLDEMVAQLGFQVAHVKLPFEPEAGAYARGHRSAPEHGHHHGHGDHHEHTHVHGHHHALGHFHVHEVEGGLVGKAAAALTRPGGQAK